MLRWLWTWVVVLAVLPQFGCGTVCNFATPVLPEIEDPYSWPRVYGGVQMDGNAFEAIWNLKGGNGRSKLLLCVPVFADCIASAAADTLTLPITVLVNQIRNPDKPEMNKESAGTGDSSQKTVVSPPAAASKDPEVIKLLDYSEPTGVAPWE